MNQSVDLTLASSAFDDWLAERGFTESVTLYKNLLTILKVNLAKHKQI